MPIDYEGDLPEHITHLGGDEYLIQGKRAGSSYEVNMAIALSNAGWEYEYLAAWWIHNKPLEIDFRTYTRPKITWLFVDGAVWHSGQESQQDKIERLQLHSLTRSFANEPIVAHNADCDNYDHAWQYVISQPYLGRRS